MTSKQDPDREVLAVMEVIGWVGRTGTPWLKLALERLGYAACHHLLEVEENMNAQVPFWTAALDGRPDWDAIYRGCASVDDWPNAGFARELIAAYPEAQFILTTRRAGPRTSPRPSASCSSRGTGSPPRCRTGWGWWSVVTRTGFPPGLSVPELMAALTAHNEAVMAGLAPDRLLVFHVREGWAPLCGFLGTPVPDGPFPRGNDRKEFWEFEAVQPQPV